MYLRQYKGVWSSLNQKKAANSLLEYWQFAKPSCKAAMLCRSGCRKLPQIADKISTAAKNYHCSRCGGNESKGFCREEYSTSTGKRFRIQICSIKALWPQGKRAEIVSKTRLRRS
eukprot:1505-Heterococcus_DN1.PRE.5